MGGAPQPEVAQTNANSKPEGHQAYPVPMAAGAGPQHQTTQSAPQGQINSDMDNQAAPAGKYHVNLNLDESTLKQIEKQGHFSTRQQIHSNFLTQNL